MTDDTSMLPSPIRKRSGTATGASRVLWAISLMATTYAAIDGSLSMQLATSAPQQAASAAMACFYAIVPYVFARGFDEITRP